MYGLQFEEHKQEIQYLIDQVEEPVKTTYQAIFNYMDLTAHFPNNYESYLVRFEQSSDQALKLLMSDDKKQQKPFWSVFQGIVFAMKAGVALGIRKSYWDAYQYGVEGVDLFDQLREDYPEFYDASLSSGILKVLVSQAPWIVQKLATWFVPTGTLEDGLSDLNLVIQQGNYAREESRLFHGYLMWARMPVSVRRKLIPQLIPLLKQYPDNIQLYFLIALGYEKTGQYRQSMNYATQGLERMKITQSVFVNHYREALNGMLLFVFFRNQVRLINHPGQWQTLAEQTQAMNDASGVSAAFHIYSIMKQNRCVDCQKMAVDLMDKIKDESLSVPFFIAPLRLSLAQQLKQVIEDMIDEMKKGGMK
ncbi:MAG: hypothetical protein HQM12_06550 [SAR324 cluster bacterium]|nr:hypothetical protein [SAR324 cluster bacterium]